MKLIIGNKRYSSWSLRPWLIMKYFNIPFEEVLIYLDLPDTEINIKKYSPTGKVPCLLADDLVIWDSLAIAEYLNEKFPEKKMWPSDPSRRALARSISNEMHSGFQKLRTHMPHDLKLKHEKFDHSLCLDDIDRIKEIWTQCLKKYNGPFLFGEFSIADAMYAPVVNRFTSYAVPVDSLLYEYMQTIKNLESHKEWLQAGSIEPEMQRYK